jgi:hypothetical protein
LERIFDRHRHAVERPPHFATRQGSIGSIGLVPSSVWIYGHDAVDPLIERFDACHKIIDSLSARNLALAYPSRDCVCTRISKVGHYSFSMAEGVFTLGDSGTLALWTDFDDSCQT